MAELTLALASASKGSTHCKIAVVVALVPVAARADLIAFECSYQTSVAANISTTLGIQTDQQQESDFVMRFAAQPVDLSAQMIGNNGASNVTAVWGEGKATFVEVTGNGTVQTTVVYGLGFGKKASAHSRTTGEEGFEMPSQYYGFCTVY